MPHAGASLCYFSIGSLNGYYTAHNRCTSARHGSDRGVRVFFRDVFWYS